jgi:carbon-monoxide dehydrogenase large subunit
MRFITGTGLFTGNIVRPNQAYAYFLRSPHGHANVRSIETAAARQAAGVIGIYTHADVAAADLGVIKCAAPLRNRDRSRFWNPGRTLLASDRVRHVGDPVAMIVAETLAQAEDAAERIAVDYETLESVVDPRAAVKPDAPKLYEQMPNNIALDWALGDLGAVEAAFAAAARVVTIELAINRVVVNSIEPRGVIGEYDLESGRYTVWLGAQGVFAVRRNLAKNLGVPESRIHVVCNDVGGSFGMKGFDFPEYTLVPWAARITGRPVKWISDRREAFLSDTQGREQWVRAHLALDDKATALAIRAESIANMGAYLSSFSLMIATIAGFRLLSGAYRIPSAYVNVRAVFTNTVWVDAYRGAGRPECSYIVERLIDAAARECGIAPDELRRRNLVSRTAMPYRNAMGETYDSGDFAAAMEEAMIEADWCGFAARRTDAKMRGKLRGIGMSYYMEVTANMPQEMAAVRFKPDDRVVMAVGTGPSGQGHETSFAQILHDRLGIPFDRIDFVFGDTDVLTQGGGTGGAKSLMLAGTALIAAAGKIIDRGRTLAAYFLETAVGDIAFHDGAFVVSGTDRLIGILELARRLREDTALPEGLPTTLDDTGLSSANQSTYPNGCHICELEVDPETGAIELCGYTVVDDFGNVVNPMIVEGQVHGGIAQGIGQAVMENAVFDPESGQLLSGSLMDYAMPRAADIPNIRSLLRPMPCATNELGVKGCGEAGTVGALGAVMNAVVDALSVLGIHHVDMPTTAPLIWQAIQRARAIEDAM